MYSEILEKLGLAKNEAKIYEAMLSTEEFSVGKIAILANIHRRNVYDSLARLREKGLVFEIFKKNETRYKAVNPDKLQELVQEKQDMLQGIMPSLQGLYSSSQQENEVYIYKGAEGWKNYMRDMIIEGEEAFFIGAKGGWLDPRVKHYFPTFEKESQEKNITFYHLFDAEVQTQFPEILEHITKNYKFLPEKFSTDIAIDIFGDRVHIISQMHLGKLSEDFSVTVIRNPFIAEGFKKYFWMMWESL